MLISFISYKYPEKFYFEGIQDLNSPIQHQYLPVYFGNVCLRFLPVKTNFDFFLSLIFKVDVQFIY
mgnify:CR=1 FL=1